MDRPLLAALAALTLAACQLAPGGRCERDADCLAGQHCSASVCVSDTNVGDVGASCAVDADCASWAVCQGHACVVATGSCLANADCPSWKECIDHACVAVPGKCAMDAHCEPWQVCTGGACRLKPGACLSGTDCQAWQSCDVAAHACKSAPGYCGSDGECVSWQTCDTTSHVCATKPGSCATSVDCLSWQQCSDTHACVPAPGRCAVATDCAGWETCAPDNTCVLAAGYCAAHEDCEAWQFCGADHLCADVGATCAATSECSAWQSCVDGHCANQPGKCGASAECGSWQVCEANTCVAAPGKCDTHEDCGGWQVCYSTHQCATVMCTSSGDCPGGSVCSGSQCVTTTLGSSSVWMVGITGTGRATCGPEAVAPVSNPDHALIGFPCNAMPDRSSAYISPTGDLIYTHDVLHDLTKFAIRRFRVDPWDKSEFGGWWYPSWDADLNDEVIPTPQCLSGPEQYWVMQPESGELLYRCRGSGDNWDTTGVQRANGCSVYAWHRSGTILGWCGTDARPSLLSPSGAKTPIPAWPLNSVIVTVRDQGDGFVLVVTPEGGLRQERWTIAADGSASLDGVYSRRTPNLIVEALYPWVLDADGALYFLSRYRVPMGDPMGTPYELVLRCPLDPADCSVLYDEATGPVTDFATTPPHAAVTGYLHRLVTGP